jgi:hypothetical protein
VKGPAAGPDWSRRWDLSSCYGTLLELVADHFLVYTPSVSHPNDQHTRTQLKNKNHRMGFFFGIDESFTSWGPFVNHETYFIQPVTRSDLATAICAFFVIITAASTAAYAGYKQTTRSREPWKSAYLWMVWMEWTSCVIMAVLCLMFIVRVVRPSFYFFMVICEYRSVSIESAMLMVTSATMGRSDAMSTSDYHQPYSYHPPRP